MTQEMPPQPKTKEIPAVVPQVPATIESVLREVRGLAGKVDRVQTTVENVSDQVLELHERVRQVEGRSDKHSEAVRGESKTNLEQDAAIAQIIVRTEAIEKNQTTAAEERAATAAKVTEIRDAVVKSAGLFTKIATHPQVVFVGRVIFVLAAGYAAAHGLKVLP